MRAFGLREALGLGLAGGLVVVLLALAGWGVSPASADWPTYHGDASRSGVDVSSGASVPLSLDWTSPTLGGDVYAEPLIEDGLVVVATESDQVYALSQSTGQVVWEASTGTPVPSGEFCGGDITPTVGITSTPVIDPAKGEVFVDAATWDGSDPSSIERKLYAFRLSDGSPVAGFPVDVEPPGDVPADQLQRAALSLDDGRVYVGLGANAGNCGTWNGYLMAVPETGGSVVASFEAESDNQGGGGDLWGSGDGPVVDPSGDLWVATANGNAAFDSFDYQESVLRLDPNSLDTLDYWAPADWRTLDEQDLDLGSSDPLLLPDGLVFQLGKDGVGYLLSASHLGGEGAAPSYSAQVCAPNSYGASKGRSVYYQGVIYASCRDGLRALALDTSNQTFAPVSGWQVTSGAVGSPIIAGGLVWVAQYGNLYGLDPQTGQVVVNQGTPSMETFTTPSAQDGTLFLATDQTVEAYTIAQPVTAPAPSVSGVSPTSGPAAGGTPVTLTGSGFSGATAVSFGGVAASSFTVDTDRQITAFAPAGSGPVDVRVTTPAGTSATSAADRYTYPSPAPTSTYTSPPPQATKPTVQAFAPALRGKIGSTLKGEVDPEGRPTTAYYVYGLDARYQPSGTTVYDLSTPKTQLGSGFSKEPVAATVSGLLPNALYHVRLVAVNAAGTTVGADQTFRTPPGPRPPPARLGRENFKSSSGIVFVLERRNLVPLTENTQLPSGTVIDALHGSLTLVAASGIEGRKYTGTFTGGVFTVTQATSGPNRGLTTISLKDRTPAFAGAASYATSCPAPAASGISPSTHSASSRRIYSVSARVAGRFATRGRWGAGTVPGTRWTTTDRCDGTLISAHAQAVRVTDFLTHQTILVTAGHHYLAHPPGP